MSSKKICNNCKRFFDEPKYYEERHGLDVPPYERIAVCPKCGSDDFFEFEFEASKFDMAERLLWVIAFINKYVANLENLYGTYLKNEELEQASTLLNEMMSEMFDYMDANMQKKLLKISTQKEVEEILLHLRG